MSAPRARFLVHRAAGGHSRMDFLSYYDNVSHFLLDSLTEPECKPAR
jgi:hypothetical protein